MHERLKWSGYIMRRDEYMGRMVLEMDLHSRRERKKVPEDFSMPRKNITLLCKRVRLAKGNIRQ